MNSQQVRNVVTYYLLKMLQTESIPNHITRDVIELNKKRGAYCGRAFNQYDIIKYIHEADKVTQINSVPQNSICMIDNKIIPNDTAGIQLIVNMNNKIKHIIIQKKYQHILYNYFRVRHYDKLCMQKIQQWFLNEAWFFPNIFKSNILLKSILQSNFCDLIQTELNELI